MVIDPVSLDMTQVRWEPAVRIIRSVFPPIDLFEDIADPVDWALIIAGEQKTNPRLVERIGALDLVPTERRVGGPGSSYLMAPFTQVSRDRPSRFSDGSFGVLYCGDSFEVAVFETAYHHAHFMSRTGEAPGWTSQFREILFDVAARLHDLRGGRPEFDAFLDPSDYGMAQDLGARLRSAGSNGVVYPSVRSENGECLGLFFPDLASRVRQGRHLDYHWNGERVDYVRDHSSEKIFALA